MRRDAGPDEVRGEDRWRADSGSVLGRRDRRQRLPPYDRCSSRPGAVGAPPRRRLLFWEGRCLLAGRLGSRPSSNGGVSDRAETLPRARNSTPVARARRSETLQWHVGCSFLDSPERHRRRGGRHSCGLAANRTRPSRTLVFVRPEHAGGPAARLFAAPLGRGLGGRRRQRCRLRWLARQRRGFNRRSERS